MSYNFDGRLAYVEEGDEVKLETQNNTYDVTVEEINYTVNGKGKPEYVRIKPQDLASKGQLFTYRRDNLDLLKADSFQPDKVVDYELEDSWNAGLGSEESLRKVAEILGWNQTTSEKAVVMLDD